MIHPEPHPLAGRTVRIIAGPLVGNSLVIEDWWDRLAGKSWMDCDGNPACLVFAVTHRPPLDDEVVYGKISGFGNLVHVSHLDEQQ